jgi:hypothetical protein
LSRARRRAAMGSQPAGSRPAVPLRRRRPFLWVACSGVSAPAARSPARTGCSSDGALWVFVVGQYERPPKMERSELLDDSSELESSEQDQTIQERALPPMSSVPVTVPSPIIVATILASRSARSTLRLWTDGNSLRKPGTARKRESRPGPYLAWPAPGLVPRSLCRGCESAVWRDGSPPTALCVSTYV